MTFLHLAFFLLGHIPKHRPQVSPQLHIQRFVPALRNEEMNTT